MNLICKRFQFNNNEIEWNDFLINAKNSSFLFNRSFMDYHKDNFIDFSLMVYSENEKLIACFPANEVDKNTISSHSGLTYGSFILKKDLKLPVIIDVFFSILKFYSDLGYKCINYKAIPRIYTSIPSDEIDYCLFLSNAKLIRRDTALVINQKASIGYSGNIRREGKKAKENGIYTLENLDFKSFWNVLTENLQQKHGAIPVHSFDEIDKLKNNFPKNIKLYEVKSKLGEVLAGTVIFEVNNVAHCQYISSTIEGRKSGALNFLFIELIDNIYKDMHYFDFGIANENDGKDLNYGLLAWKERIGGRTISHDFYNIEAKNHLLIHS